MMTGRTKWLTCGPMFLLAAATMLGCVRAPSVVIVDRKTALEQQASGSFRGLEEELEQAGAQPRPAPLTSAQLAGAGVDNAIVDDEAGAQAGGEVGNDATRTDALLVQRCIGEALESTLALTIDQCTGTIDVPLVNRMIERVNRERRQLWRWIGERAPGKTPEQVRASWRETHLTGLICGGQLQLAGGGWEVKRC
jgi:hypothetical protein